MSKQKKSRVKRIGLLLTMMMVFTMVTAPAAPVAAHGGNHDEHDHENSIARIRVEIKAGDGGTINSPGGQNIPSLNETWSFTAIPDPGYRFDHWTYDGNEVSGAFLTDANNPDLSVKFIEDGWDGWKMIDIQQYKAQAVFAAIPQYTLETSISGNGSISKEPNKTTFYEGDSVRLTATPDSGWEFAGWSGAVTSSNNTIDVTMDSNKSITATFTEIPKYSLTVNVSGNGSVTKTPDAATYLRGTSVQLTANPDPGHKFTGWSGAVTDSSSTINVTMDGNKSITATFVVLPKYTLNIGVNPAGSGSVSKNPNVPEYWEGREVTLTPSAASGWRFKEWSGDASGGADPLKLSMDGNKSVVANFQKQFFITLNASHGHFDDEDAVEGWRDENAEIDLANAKPDNNLGYMFIGWKDNGTDQMITDYKTKSYKFAVTSNRTFTAMFGDREYMTVGVNNHNMGYLKNNLDGHYGRGAAVDLNDAEPTAKTGYTFDHWEEFNSQWEAHGNIADIGDWNIFRAVFKLKEYTVSFEENGGSEVADQTVTHGYKASRPSGNPTRTGYDFDDWYSDSGLTNKFNFNTAITGDTTIYAKWTPHTYTVVYHANTGEGTMDPSTHTYDAEKKLTANTFTKEGCSFVGWATSQGGDKAYDDEKSVVNLTAVNGAEFHLYARWSISGVKVDDYIGVYDGDGHGVKVSGYLTTDTITYSTDGGATYSSVEPLYTNVTSSAGETVHVKVERDGADDFYGSAVVKITKATLTVKADDKVITYGDDAPPYTPSYDGFVEGDDEGDLSGAPSLTCPYVKGNDAGAYTITAALGTLVAVNYDFDFSMANGTLTVGKATLTVKADDKVITYGDDAPPYTPSYDGFVEGDDEGDLSGAPSLTCPYVKGNDAGAYTITVTPGTLGAVNYDFDFSMANGTLTVGKATLTVKADDKVITYGDDAPPYTPSYDGFVEGDDEGDLSGAPSLTCPYVKGNDAGAYTITVTPGTLVAVNYDFDFSMANGTLTVGKATLTVKADDKVITYGDDAPPYTPSYDGFVEGDDEGDLIGAPSLTCPYVKGNDAGTYTITATLGTLGAVNYDFDFSMANGTLTVGKATLMVKADNKNITYYDAAPYYTKSYSGFVGNDDRSVLSGSLSLKCSYKKGDGAGSYPITVSDNTLSAMNYDISFSEGSLYVRKAALKVTADDKSVTFGDAAPSYTAKYSGFKGDDDESVLSGSLVFRCAYTAGSPVSGSPYSITPSGYRSGKYTITYVPGELTVSAPARSAGAAGAAPTPSPSPSVSPSPTPESTPAPEESATPPADTGGDNDTEIIEDNDVPAGTANAKGTGFFSHWWSWMILVICLLLLLLILLLILSKKRKQEQH